MRDHDERRRRLVSHMSGRVVEIGAGSGLTFRHYPLTVDRVVAVEPDPERRAAAEAAARNARVSIEVVDAVAEELPLEGATADAAVVSLALCSVSDPNRALGELRRVIRPEGELRFFEHVIAEGGPLRLIQRLAAPVYSRGGDGCHIDRDTVASISRAGFVIEECDRFMQADGALEPAIPHVIGTARKAKRFAMAPERRRRARSVWRERESGVSEADLRWLQMRINR